VYAVFPVSVLLRRFSILLQPDAFRLSIRVLDASCSEGVYVFLLVVRHSIGLLFSLFGSLDNSRFYTGPSLSIAPSLLCPLTFAQVGSPSRPDVNTRILSFLSKFSSSL